MHRAFLPAALAALVAVPVTSAPTLAAVERTVRPASRLAPAETIRPTARESVRRAVPRPVSAPAADPVAPGPETAFAAWRDGFADRARAAGISDAVLAAAFEGVTPDPDVIRLDRNQSEFTKTIWDYLDAAVSDTRVTRGRAAYRDHAETLARIEARYGVPAEVVVAVWGLETSFGAYRGSNDVIRSLATLAHDGRRSEFFEAQLMAALRILQAGDVPARAMRGSWAGAMGHTQFMPTSFLDHAVDFDGDGRRDIWGEDPTDALASAANYLARHGWQAGQPWGVEVALPDGFDYGQTGHRVRKAAGEWAAQGVRDVAGRAVPDHGPASIILPAGAQGAAFMVFENFRVIERYNPADAYVIGVGHLADRIAGAGPIRGGWPRGDRALAFSERKELQLRLTRAGFDTQGVDGRIGPNTEAAIRRFQTAQGLVPDGYASPRLLDRLR